MTPIVVQDGNKIKIPTQMAKQIGIAKGMKVYIYQLGSTLSIRPKPSPLFEACEEFESAMLEDGVTLNDLLRGLEEEREILASEQRERRAQ